MGALRCWTGLSCAVVLLGAVGCSSTHGTGSAGTGGGGTGGAAPTPPAWQVVYDDTSLGGAVLSAWGTGPKDVYVVGGPLGDTGFEAVAVHYDGTAWTRLSPGGAASFWWVHGSGPGDIWMVGEQGRITHWDGKAFTESKPLTTATMWGVWAASPTDAWAVGGTPEGGTSAPNDIVLHWDGAHWAQETLPGTPLGRSLYKVWGTASSDLYVVGEAGTIWHRKGTAWAQEANPATSTLFTVYGCSATDVYAVGGQRRPPLRRRRHLDPGLRHAGQLRERRHLQPGRRGPRRRLRRAQAAAGGRHVDERLHHQALGRPARVLGRRRRRVLGRRGRLSLPATPGKPRNAVIARYGAGTVPLLSP